MFKFYYFYNFEFNKILKMNILKAIYCNQYYALKKDGKEYAAKKNANIIATITIILFIFSIFLLLMTFVPDLDKEVNRFFRRTFGRGSGKLIGQLIVLLLFGSVYPLLKFTIGSNRVYNKTIEKFLSFPKELQQKISDKGLVVFILSMVSIFLSFIAILVKTYVF